MIRVSIESCGSVCGNSSIFCLIDLVLFLWLLPTWNPRLVSSILRTTTNYLQFDIPLKPSISMTGGKNTTCMRKNLTRYFSLSNALRIEIS